MRFTFMVGKRLPRAAWMLARRCAWCSKWASPWQALKAKLGAPITHGICPTCERSFHG